MAAERQNNSGIATRGRSHLATSDKVFERLISLPEPTQLEAVPFYQSDVIPKDLFFPIEANTISDALAKLPASETDGITHIYLRRPKASDFRNGRIPLAEYIALDEAAVIVFYPWPATLRIPITKKPSDKILNRYKRWRPVPISHKGKWNLEWRQVHAADFCASDLVRQMVAVHAEFRAKHAAREMKRGTSLPIAYANQRYLEENYEIW